MGFVVLVCCRFVLLAVWVGVLVAEVGVGGVRLGLFALVVFVFALGCLMVVEFGRWLV